MQKSRVATNIAIFIICLFFSMISARQAFADAETSPVILEGVFIDGVDVSGMTREEAVQAVADHMEDIKGYHIQMHIGDHIVSATAGELGLYWKNEDVVDKALAFGQAGNIVSRYKAKQDLQQETVRFVLEYGVKADTAKAMLNEKCVPLDCEPQNASMTRTEDGFQIVKETQGVKIKVDESVEVLSEYLSELWRAGLGVVELPAEITEPEHKSSELEQVQDILGSASTDYSSSSSARAQNIVTGTGFLNGSVLYPGESFSVESALVPFSAENGYEPAPSYENGDVVDSYGGGICQVSTTLYMALLRAEIEITERYNHSMIVKYVKPSMDAAIAEGSKDLQFVNNLDAPVYIEGYTDGGEVGFVIYGKEYRPENRKVTYESETLETVEPTVELTASQDPLGTIRQTSSSHTGYTACLWKTVTVDGVEESREQVNSSTYNMTPTRYTVGVSTSDGTAASEIQAAVDSNDLDKVYSVINKYS